VRECPKCNASQLNSAVVEAWPWLVLSLLGAALVVAAGVVVVFGCCWFCAMVVVCYLFVAVGLLLEFVSCCSVFGVCCCWLGFMYVACCCR